MTDRFGSCDLGRPGDECHKGTDLATGSCGIPIWAAGGGTVTFLGVQPLRGNVVWIDHGNGIESGYFHMEDGSLRVAKGDRIAAGTQIATMGETGYSFGCHLHFEIHNNGKPINPEPFMQNAGAPCPDEPPRKELPMSIRFITGRLSAEPEVQQAGRIQITKFTVLENTYEYRGDERIEGQQPLAHYVEAKFELGANAASSLRKGDAVIVVGAERDASFEGRDGTVYRRIIDASAIGPDLAHATALIASTRRASAAAKSSPAGE